MPAQDKLGREYVQKSNEIEDKIQTIKLLIESAPREAEQNIATARAQLAKYDDMISKLPDQKDFLLKFKQVQQDVLESHIQAKKQLDEQIKMAQEKIKELQKQIAE